MTDELWARVRQLDATQLAELQTYIKGLRSVGAARGAAPAGDELLLEVFEESCRKYGFGFAPPPVKALVRKREANLIGFLDKACPGSSALVRRAILATAIDLLYEDAQANGRVMNARNLAYGLDRLPAILDRSFPAYAACGILAKIIRKAA